MKTTKTDWLPESHNGSRILYIQVTDRESLRFMLERPSGKRESSGNVHLSNVGAEDPCEVSIPFFNMNYVNEGKDKPRNERILEQVKDAIFHAAEYNKTAVKYCYVFHHRDNPDLVAICCNDAPWTHFGFMQYEPFEVE